MTTIDKSRWIAPASNQIAHYTQTGWEKEMPNNKAVLETEGDTFAFLCLAVVLLGILGVVLLSIIL